MKVLRVEYIWLDGGDTPSLRAKTKVIRGSDESVEQLIKVVNDGKSPHDMFPVWGFDGSSTMQASSDSSDCVLKPVFCTVDPNRPNSFLVLCEVFDTDGSPHSTNTRASLRQALTESNLDLNPRVGFEQEYTLYDKTTGKPCGWPVQGLPEPQGSYYCGVGVQNVASRDLVESHLGSMIACGISVEGINAEVMLGQWEYQVGGTMVDVLTASDHLWLSRYLLDRIAESSNCYVSLDPKPESGDWNGSGLHTNFSTSLMREEEGSLSEIEEACAILSQNVDRHLSAYGTTDGLRRRLTGSHETADLDEFRWGIADRGASIRIPWHVSAGSTGYLEDRRPNSDADPYRVVTAFVNTLCSNTNDSTEPNPVNPIEADGETRSDSNNAASDEEVLEQID
jgi:glutamine synthetase